MQDLCYDWPMQTFGINYEKLQIFRLLCQLQSFSLVAKTINTNQSVISRDIQDLERILGKKLILKNQKPLMLTDYGKKLYALLIEMNHDIDHVEENLAVENMKQKHDQLRVFISISMILGCILADRIRQLLEAFPEIYIDISFTNEVTMDLLNKKDIVITRTPYMHSLVENRFINRHEMVFGVSREYLKKRGFPKFASSLRHHDFLYVKDYYYDVFATKNILNNISNQYLIDNELAVAQSVSAGGGVGIFPKFITQSFPNIITFELEDKLNSFEIYATVSKVKTNSYIDLITDFLQHEL